MIMHRLMMIIFYSRQPDTPEDNADPVGQTTTKGLLLWWFDAVFKIVIR